MEGISTIREATGDDFTDRQRAAVAALVANARYDYADWLS